MKYIYLIRHAKSSWSEENQSDFDRTLNKRGKKDLQYMAIRLQEFGVKPSIIFSSPAKRAQKTTKIIAETLDFNPKKIVYEKALYDSSYTTYRYLIDSIDDKHETVFIVAHNPTLTEVGEKLTGAILTNIPTCSIVCIEFDVDSFKDIEEECGKVIFFDYPSKHDIA